MIEKSQAIQLANLFNKLILATKNIHGLIVANT